MRYATTVAMPAGLGEWLGAELEARGVEAASLYARAVLSILLHSEAAELVDMNGQTASSASAAAMDVVDSCGGTWNRRAALELELRMERHAKQTRRGRPSTVKRSFNKSGHKRSANVPTSNNGRNHMMNSVMVRRRPHSWNGGRGGGDEEEAMKKCAAIECLLSATDDGQWGPVEQLVDELCARLKLLQMEQNGVESVDGRVRKQHWGGKGGSAPECFEAANISSTSSNSSSDSDSFTSVSTPNCGQEEDYRQAFPPLDSLSDLDQEQPPVANDSIWNVRKAGSDVKKTPSRVRFLRMPGTRLSPAPLQLASSMPTNSYGESCTSEAYFGDCSRDSSLERPVVSPLQDAATSTKGRLYERGGVADAGAALGDFLDSAFKSLCQFNEQPAKETIILTPPAPSMEWGNAWSNQQPTDGDPNRIWAPLESDWALIAPWPGSCSTMTSLASAGVVPADAAVQLSLALLNHHPERSGFSPVLAAKSLLQRGAAHLPRTSKLMAWLASLSDSEPAGASDFNEKEVESIFEAPERSQQQLPTTPQLQHLQEPEEEPENLLTSPKTHFCPIQQEGDAEVQVSDGATFDVDGQPEQVHFIRSPSGALYLPDCEENRDGWKGWSKYQVYKTPTSPSPQLLVPQGPSSLVSIGHEQQQQPSSTATSRTTSPFTLKFRVVQTEKCCQTDARLSIDSDQLTTRPLAISSPFSAAATGVTPVVGLLGVGDVWKFDPQAVTKEMAEVAAEEPKFQPGVDDHEVSEEESKEEEVDGLLNELWNVTTVLTSGDDAEDDSVDPVNGEEDEAVDELEQVVEKVEKEPGLEEEYDLDELWNPFMEETGEDQVDVCEWIPQTAYAGANDECDGQQWTEEDFTATAESWPPPNIPIEYLDDDFFDEIYGSLDSMKSSEVAAPGSSAKSGGSRRRRRRASQKQTAVAVRRPKRPCSFFVEGECRRPDCKFSHDLGSITCRFWIESSCFKGEECPFLHGVPAKENERTRSCSEGELSESCGSEEALESKAIGGRVGRNRGGSGRRDRVPKKFQFDLEADFPSLLQASRGGPSVIVSQSKPISITQGFATADLTGSSLEEPVCSGSGSGLKRRRKRFPSARSAASVVVIGGTSSTESSPADTAPVSLPGKRSRKLAKVVSGQATAAASKRIADVSIQSERRRTKSEHDAGIVLSGHGGSSRLSSSYKEG